MYRKNRFFIVIILTIVLLILGACKAGPAETVTMTITQPATTVTQSAATVTQPAATITKTVTTTIGQTQTSTSTTSTVISTTSTKTSTTKTTIIPPGATAITAEAQIVTSTDGELQCSNLNLYESYGWVVRGTAKNLSSSTLTAEIKVQTFDRSGQLLGTTFHQIEKIEPGKNATFEFNIEGDRFLVTSYIIEIYSVP